MFALLYCLALPAVYADDVGAGSTQSPDDRAKELYENGADLYDEGRYEDAVAAWQESYKLSNKPLLLYNIANAEERAGHYDVALDNLNRYRAFATADEREILDRRIRNLEARIDQTKASSPTTSPIATPPVTTAPVVTTPPVAATTTSASKVHRAGPSLPTYLLGGIGVAGVGAGAVFGVEATQARVLAAAGCTTANKVTLCSADAKKPLANDKLDSLLADISFGVGAAGIAGSVLVMLLGEPVGFVPLGDGGLVTVGGRF